MKKSDQERIFIYRRILNKNKDLSFLSERSDLELLDILNSTVLPNSILKNNLKLTLFSSLILNHKDTEKIVKRYLSFTEILNRVEKDIFKFGLFYGFDSYNSSYQYSRFIKTSVDISEGELRFKKKISSVLFENIFDFMYKIIFKGEKNGQFPRI